MKNLCYLFISITLFTACSSKDLDKETALKLLQEQKDYPKTIETDIYVADPVDATKLFKSDLEKEGYVNIAHTQKLADVGKPIITFTDKAKPYLIPQTTEDKKNNIQRVKVAEEFIMEILNVKMDDDGKSALVEYSSLLKRKTPFYAVSGIGVNVEKVIKKVKFIRNKTEWSFRF
ncbi:hypothetical protein [Pedobacter cryophilus]|uniref:Lipoprotein n=1 Tax=Pedobacter cryophilus TaxID=2571271 RepID=A0A4U1C1R7_9SPHI|nr:hypothetical protein [Pedobacter cryophilus]TKB99171.1 hypothetical protein FA046_08680 [Pedobacter cryophilus]